VYLAIFKRRNEMAEQGKTYKCEICGQVVKVIESGAGELVCCGEPMVKID
jgi:superoxide reductase